MNINKNISKYNFNTGSVSRIKYIVIHFVGSVSTAYNNTVYFAGGDRGSSAHYFVDESSIWQSVEDNNTAWHCGATSYKHLTCRNANSIGVEMCVKKDANGKWYFEDKTVENTICLTKYLMEKYNVPVENVIRHYDVTGKDCPAPYVSNTTKHTWDNFKKGVVTVKGEWVRAADGIRWWFRLNGDNNQYYKGYFYNINGYRYLFDNQGYACTGHTTWGDKSYFFWDKDDNNMGKMMCTDPANNYSLGFVKV